MSTGILAATRSLLTALRAAGADTDDPDGPAPWGSRVDLRATTDVVQIGGARAGDPQALTWPCLLLFGPDVTEVSAQRRPGERAVYDFNPTAHTVKTRKWPRVYDLTFRVVWQTRSGFGTGAHGDADAVTAMAQCLTGIARWERWIDTHRTLNEALVFADKALAISRSPRITAADIIEATGLVRLAWVQEFSAAEQTVPADSTLVTSVTPVAGADEFPGA